MALNCVVVELSTRDEVECAIRLTIASIVVATVINITDTKVTSYLGFDLLQSFLDALVGY